MKEELRQLLETARGIYRDFYDLPSPVPETAVRDYLYPDGAAIVRMFLPSSDMPPDDFLSRLQDADGWSLFRPGTWFEGSFLFAPGDGRAYKSRNRGMQQIQSFGTRKVHELFWTLRRVLWPKLESIGYPPPSAYLFRVARTIDDSKPFKKKDPPITWPRAAAHSLISQPRARAAHSPGATHAKKRKDRS